MGRDRDTGEDREIVDSPWQEDDGEGFDSPELVDLTEQPSSSEAVFYGPGDEDDDDEGFDEPEYVEKGDEPGESRDE